MKRLFRSLIVGALLATLIPAMASAAVTTVDCLDGNGAPSGSFTIEDNVITGNTNCAGSAVIPDGVLQIGVFAFANSTTLESVTIPTSVTSIGAGAFYQAGLLTSITIPNSVTSLGADAFSGASLLTSITLSENLTSIEDSTFVDCISLQSITIPDSVLNIYQNAFTSTTSLQSVTLSNNLISIGDYAFSGATSLTSIVLPNSVTTLGEAVFKNTTSLSSVTLSDNLTSIPASTFQNALALHSISIPGSVTSIGLDAFAGATALTTVTLSNGLVTIGDNAFYHAISLSSLNIPNTVTSIGNAAFSDNVSLASITLSNNLESIGSNAFWYATALTNIDFPSSLTSIGVYAFAHTSSLTSFRFYGARPNAGWEAFSSPASGAVVYVAPSNLASFGVAAGDTWNGLVVDTFTPPPVIVDCRDSNNDPSGTFTIEDNVVTSSNNCGGSAIIPAGVTSIGNYTFIGATSLTSITIPSSVETIGSGAFENTPSLETVTLTDGLISIGNYAFIGATSLTSITIPSSVTSIGAGAFENTTALSSITLPNNIAAIRPYTFLNATALTSITIPSSVTSIGAGAFENTTSLRDVYFLGSAPSNVSQYAFSNLPSGAKVHVTATRLASFGVAEGQLWNGLTVATFTPPPVIVDCRDSNNDPSGTFTIVDNVVTGNTNCAGSADIPDGVTSISNSAFYSATSLETVTMTNSVTSIGTYAFYGTSSLTNIRLSESITAIAQSTFDAASALKSIIIPEGVTSIGFIAFIGAVSLETVTLPSTLNSIGPDAFENMPLLRSITIPSGVTSIGEKAFDRDLSLANVYFLGAAPLNVGPNAFGTVAANAKAYVTAAHLASFGVAAGDLWNGLIVETFTVPVILLVGDTGPAGGKIFITPQTAGNTTGLYFEVAPVDVSNSRYTFCNQTNQLISGTLNSGIGYGESNTAAMIDWGCSSGAAVATDNFSFGGFSDWFLPSLDEAAELFSTQAATGVFEGADTHWTSTGYNANTSWTRYFSGNITDNLDQTAGGGFYVRAVRSFCLECNDELSVPTVPDAPTITGTEVINSTTVKITFGAPANSGGATIETFTVTSTPDSLVGELSSSVGGFVTVSGLNPSNTYTFTVTATNSVGTSLASDPSEPITLSDTNGGGNSSFSCGDGGSYHVINGVFTVDWNNPCSGPLVLDPSVTTLQYATYLYAVTSLTIPATTTVIDDSFIGRSAITEYIVDSENPNFQSIDGVLYSKDGTRLISYPQSKAGQSFTLPNEVTEVANGAFHALNELQIVNITESATVSTASFNSCCNGNTGNTLQEINVDENNSNFASVAGVLFNRNKTELLFYPTDKPGSNYVVPSSVQYFTGAFNGNKNLVSLVLPDGFLGMQTYEFAGAENLESITLPASTTDVGNFPFYSARKMQSINVAPENLVYKSIDGVLFSNYGDNLIEYPDGKTAEEFVFPTGLVTIPGQWVSGNPYLRKITIPATVESIGSGYLSGVTHITFEGDSQIFSIATVWNDLMSNLSVSYCGASNSVMEAYFADAGSYACGFPAPSLTVPGSPGSVEAVAIDSSTVTITFAIGSNGGAAFETFTATSDPGSITGVLTAGTAGYITVTGLTPGAAYTFTVTATNSVGTSAPSAPSASITMPSGSAPPTDNSSNNQSPSAEEIARAQEIKHQNDVAAARGEILRRITSGDSLTVQLFIKAELLGVDESNLASVSERLAMLNSKSKITIEVVIAVVYEYKIVGDIATKRRVVFSSELITIGLITKSELHKTAILKGLKALPSTRLNTYSKLENEIKAIQAPFEARAKKLQAKLKR